MALKNWVSVGSMLVLAASFTMAAEEVDERRTQGFEVCSNYFKTAAGQNLTKAWNEKLQLMEDIDPNISASMKVEIKYAFDRSALSKATRLGIIALDTVFPVSGDEHYASCSLSGHQ